MEGKKEDSWSLEERWEKGRWSGGTRERGKGGRERLEENSSNLEERREESRWSE